MKINKILLLVLVLALIGSGLLGLKTLGLSRQNQELVRNNQELEEKIQVAQAREKDQAKLKEYENTNPSLTSKQIRFFEAASFKTDFKEENLDLIYDEFIDPLSWESLGFSVEDSQTIGDSLGQNPSKTRSIITAMLRQGKSLKLVLLPKENSLILKYGAQDLDQDEAPKDKNKLSKLTPNNQGITGLEIDIDYGDRSVELDYSVYQGQVRASLEDEVSQLYLYGDQAKDLIEEKILGLNFPATRDLAIEDSLRALGLKKDFTSYKISLDYENGQAFNYRLKK